MVSIIVAMAKNKVIGSKNELPWYLPADLKHFAQITKGHSVIVGRKTFESIFKKLGKPLPQRKNIIITRQEGFEVPGATVVKSLEEAITAAGNGEVFVIGGAEIYKLALPLTDKMYITFVEAEINGDIKFPNYDASEWNQVSSEPHNKDEKNQFNFTFDVYERKK